jgi:hypothetical protein
MLRLATWISLAVPAIVLAFAGFSKIADPFPIGDFLSRVLFLPIGAAATMGQWLGVLEVAIAGCVCLSFGRSRVPAYLALCLLVAFTGLLVEVLYFWPDLASCGCLGNLTVGSLRLSPRLQLFIDAGLFFLLCSHLLLLPRFRGVQRLGPISPEDAGSHGTVEPTDAPL